MIRKISKLLVFGLPDPFVALLRQPISIKSIGETTA